MTDKKTNGAVTTKTASNIPSAAMMQKMQR